MRENKNEFNLLEEQIQDREKIETCSDVVIDSFYGADNKEESFEPQLDVSESDMLEERISSELKALMDSSCFDIDVIEVDIDEKTAYIFIDGQDSALLIGKIGYRYNALYYMISQWIQSRYDMHTKLEIAKFIAEQSDNVATILKPVIEHVEQEGWGKSRVLDGVLVELALEQLREKFPDRYVAIKKRQDGKRYVLVNKFNER